MRLPTDDELALREACREVLSKHSTSANVRLVMSSVDGFDAEFWTLVTDLGWPALAIPEAFGGLGGSVGQLAVVAEELGRSGQPGPLVQTLAVAHVVGRPAARDADRAGFLDAIAGGRAVVTFGGIGPDSPAPVEVIDAPGGATLRGVVEFVPDGHCATHLLVPVHRAGTVRTAVVELSGTARTVVPTVDLTRRYTRVGLDGVPVAVELPGAAIDALFELAVVLQCAESTGIARRLLDLTVTYAGQREQFGRPIGSFQAIKHRIADLLVEVEGCRVATREAADALDAGAGAGSSSAAGVEAVSIAKSWVGRAASFVASHALQIHGGIGFSWEHDLHLFLRRAKANELLLGSPAWHDERLYRSVLGEISHD